MPAYIPPSAKRRNAGAGIALLATSLTAGWIIILPVSWFFAVLITSLFTHMQVSFLTALASGIHHIKDSIIYYIEYKLHSPPFHRLGSSVYAYDAWKTAHAMTESLYIYSAYTIQFFSVFFIIKFAGTKKSGVMQIGGLIRSDDVEESVKIARKHLKKGGGVILHPAAGRMSIQSETRHFCYAGMSGAGKTQALQHPLFSAIERGDRVLIHDFKGDFSRMFSEEDYRSGRVVMLCPWDRRGLQHHAINKDVTGIADADLVASTLLPGDKNSSGEYWGKAAEDVLGGILDALRIGTKKMWSWPDFAAMFRVAEAGDLAGKPAPLMHAIRQYRAGAAVHTSASEQAAGVLGNIRADIKFIDKISHFWRRREHGFSIRNWINNSAHTQTKILILKGSPTHTWFRPVISTQLALALSEAMALPERDNKLWFFIDELPQLPRISNLKDALLTLRSKGARIVIGLQDAAALTSIYGEEDVRTMIGMCATKVFGQASGEQAEWSAGWFSGAESERRQDTIQANQSSSDAASVLFDNALSASTSYQHQETKAVPAHCFETLEESKPVSKISEMLGGYGGPSLYVKSPDFAKYVLKLKFKFRSLPTLTAHDMLRSGYLIDAKPAPVKPHKLPGFVSDLFKILDSEKEKVVAVSTQDEQKNHVVTTESNQKNVGDDENNIAESEDLDTELSQEILQEVAENTLGVGSIGNVMDVFLAGDASTNQSKSSHTTTDTSDKSGGQSKKKKKTVEVKKSRRG